jgi:hypothetical protein
MTEELSTSRRTMIWAASVVGVIGFIFMSIGIPAVNAKIVEISVSTRNDIRQDAELTYLNEKYGRIEMAITKLTDMNVAIARIEEQLKSFEVNHDE